MTEEARTFDNDNTGVLFKNDRKTTDKQPDARGSATVDGVEYWVSAWRKTSKDGSKTFTSLAFTKKDAAAAPASGQLNVDDLPF